MATIMHPKVHQSEKCVLVSEQSFAKTLFSLLPVQMLQDVMQSQVECIHH